MASRALMVRLSRLSSSRLGSTRTGGRFGAISLVSLMSLCRLWRSSCKVFCRVVLGSINCVCSGCRRAKSSNLRVMLAPLSTAVRMVSSWRSSRGSVVCRAPRSVAPRMMVSRLLKSWARPPVNWPSASSFCACINCSRASSRRCWASRRSVMSRVILARPISLPCLSYTVSSTVSAQKRLPSLRSRQPSSRNRPSRSATESARSGFPAARSSSVKKHEKCSPRMSSRW